MHSIDLKKIRLSLPGGVRLTIRRKDYLFLEYFSEEIIAEEEFKMIYEWQKIIITPALIYNLFIFEPGRKWVIYLIDETIELINITDEDAQNFLNG